MQLIIRLILLKFLDKKLLFCPQPQKKSMNSLRVIYAIFLDFIWRNNERGWRNNGWEGGGVADTMKWHFVSYILLSCYLKWTPNNGDGSVKWMKIFGVELHYEFFGSCECSELSCETIHLKLALSLPEYLVEPKEMLLDICHKWVIWEKMGQFFFLPDDGPHFEKLGSRHIRS